MKSLTTDGPDYGNKLENPSCNKACKREVYCKTRSSTHYKARTCMGLKPDY